MSGATIPGLGGKAARRFPDDFVPRQTFGQRSIAAEERRAAMMARAVDGSVPALRQRIGDNAPLVPMRLPWAIGGTLIARLSVGLWLNLFEVSSSLARVLARLL